MDLRSALRRPRTYLIGIPLLVLLVAVVAPYVYIHFIKDDPPARLALAQAPAAESTSDSAAAGGELDGIWTIGTGSQAGYRVDEILFGQDAEAVGRTSDVTGQLVVEDTVVETATFTVDMTTVTSDESRRDNQFRGRIMDTATYPEATFELTDPIAFDEAPADLEQVAVEATGELTLRGTTNPVSFQLVARRNGNTVEVNGTIPIVFDDYGIPDASFGPAQVGDEGEIEFLLVFQPAS